MKTGIIVTAYCAEPFLNKKLEITEQLCTQLSKLNKPLCLTTHSPLPETTQQLCNGYIYDKDNDFHINGKPVANRTHGLAELKSVHNGVNFLVNKFNITHFLKVTYDVSHKTNFNHILNRSEELCNAQKKLVSCQWNTREPSISTMLYFCDVNFFFQVFDLEDVTFYINQFEANLYRKFTKLNVIDSTHIEKSYNDFLGVRVNHCVHWGGRLMDPV